MQRRQSLLRAHFLPVADDEEGHKDLGPSSLLQLALGALAMYDLLVFALHALVAFSAHPDIVALILGAVGVTTQHVFGEEGFAHGCAVDLISSARCDGGRRLQKLQGWLKKKKRIEGYGKRRDIYIPESGEALVSRM